MQNKLLAFIRQQNMISPGDTVIAAVSGGADSVALLFALYLLKEKLGIQLEAAHFNHHLRAEESDRDETFVRNLCDRYDIPLHVGGGEVKAGKKGLEAAARDARYAFFATLSGKIATAHTADDNAETVLMHLVRGTGLKGLGGITPVRGNLIRPMLTVTRQENETFLAEWCLHHVEDSSNASDAFLRNRLRHHVMPLLKGENPRLAENLSQMALRLRLDEACLAGQLVEDPGVAELEAMHPALRSRQLEKFLKESGIREPEDRHIKAAESLLYAASPSARVDLPGASIARNYDRLEVLPEQTLPAAVELPCPGSAVFGDYTITCAPAAAVIDGPDVFTVVPQGTMTLTSRQSGDTIRLSGGTKRLKKLYIDRKIPASQRPKIPVLRDGAGVLGVCGIGVSLDRAAGDLPAVTVRFTKKEKKSMHKDLEKVLLTEEQITERIDQLGEVLTRDYQDKNPVIIGVLNGVVVFYADMVRKIQVPCQMDFMSIASYEGTTSSGNTVLRQDLKTDIENRHVLILEDIFDTGRSLSYTVDLLKLRKPASIKICTLLDKPERRLSGVTLQADYVGFTIPNAFVVGYGLDYNERYRNLPYIGILKPEVYSD